MSNQKEDKKALIFLKVFVIVCLLAWFIQEPALSLLIGMPLLLAAIFLKFTDIGRLYCAAWGQKVNVSDIVAIYWKQYNDTLIPKSDWMMMSKSEKSAIYLKREKLRTLFDSMPDDLKSKIMRGRSKKKLYKRDMLLPDRP